MHTSIADGASRPGVPATCRAIAGTSLGALVTFPALVPGGAGGLRLTDLAGLLALVALALALASGRPLHRAAGTLALALLLSAAWVGAEAVAASLGTDTARGRMLLPRWIEGLALGYWLAALMGDPRWRGAVAAGLAVGLLLSVASVAVDGATFDPRAVVLDPDVEESLVWIGEEYRAAGIFSHPNAAAGTILLLVPLVIGLREEGRVPALALLAPLGAIAAVFAFTATRGPTAIAVALLAWHVAGRTALRRATAVACGAALLALSLAAGPSDGGAGGAVLDRLSDTQNVAGNAGERLGTTLAALELSLTHPFGLGSGYEALLKAATGFTATHNAHLQLALMGGVALAGFVAFRLVRTAALLFASGPRRVEGWVAAYLAAAFLFENYYFVPTIPAAVAWLLWRPAAEGPAAIEAIPGKRA